MENQEKKSRMGLYIGIGIFLFFGIIALIMGVSASNSEVRLRNQAEAQEQVCKNTFDNMYKTIKQIAEVTDQHKQAFKDIFLGMTEGRYENDQQVLMKWVQESNPNFNMGLFGKLADVIEAKRGEFKHEQDKLADIVREHKDLLGTWPSSMFVGGRPALNMTFVSSGYTKEVYRTGEENDIDVFNKKK